LINTIGRICPPQDRLDHSLRRQQNEMIAIRKSDLTLVLLSIVAASALTALFFPGMMSYDSLYQYRQVIGTAPITNDHPPVMVHLWRLGHAVIPSPGALLLLHQTIYWAAVALFAWNDLADTHLPACRLLATSADTLGPSLERYRNDDRHDGQRIAVARRHPASANDLPRARRGLSLLRYGGSP
jgi:hypothetical protein